MKLNFLFFSTFAISYAFASSSNNVNLGDISEEIIKPASPQEYNNLIGKANGSDDSVGPASPSDVTKIPKKPRKKAKFDVDGIVFGINEMLTEDVMNMLGAAQSYLINNDFQPEMRSHPYVLFVENHFYDFLDNRKRMVCLSSLWVKTIVALVESFFPEKEPYEAAEKIMKLMGFKHQKKGSFSNPKNFFRNLNIIGYNDSPQIITYFLFVLAQHEKHQFIRHSNVGPEFHLL